MKFIYSCDIHGDKDKYEKLLELAINSECRNIVIAGDLLPKKGKDREKLQREFIHGWFKDYLRRVNNCNVRFIAILGNDDVEAIEDDYNSMISNYENVYNIDKTRVDIEDVSFIGLSEVLDTPFFRKNRIAVEEGMTYPIQRHDQIEINKGRTLISKEEWEKYRSIHVPNMSDLLNNLPAVKEGNKGIFVFHDPPFGIGLDMCRDGDVVGSREIARYISLKKPYMTLHGHVHESFEISGKWYEKIGKTICMNCGQTEYEEKDLHFAMIDTIRNLFVRKTKKCNRDLERDYE